MICPRPIITPRDMGAVIEVCADRSSLFTDGFSDVAPLIMHGGYLDATTQQLLMRVSVGFAKRISYDDTCNVLSYSISRGYVGLLDYSLSLGCEWTGKFYEQAVTRGDCAVIRWGVSQGYAFPDKFGDVVYSARNYRVLVECVNSGLEIGPRIAQLAAEMGILDIVKRAHVGFLNGTALCRNAAIHGRLNVVKYLHSKGIMHMLLQGIAARCGHLHILKWLYSVGEDLNNYTIREAIRTKKFHVVRWLWKKRESFAGLTVSLEDLIHYAGSFGSTEIVEWLETRR
jgi:hypothetical protein